jgi:CRISPR-associated protein Csb2
MTAERAAAFNALQWLEILTPPLVEAHAFAGQRSRFQVALPLNNRKGSALLEGGLQLAPVRRVSAYDLPGEHPRVLVVRYLWTVPAEAIVPLDDLREMAARISYFGRAEDRAEFTFALAEEQPSPHQGHQRWIPARWGTVLAAPERGSLDALKQLHNTKLPPRVRKPNTLTCFKHQPYRPQSSIEFPQPVCVSILKIVDEAGDEMSFDPLASNKYRAQVRAAICALLRGNTISWADDAFAGELISGHAPDGSSSRNPHLAIVPLPSLNRQGTARGQVHRFALAGYANEERANEAREIYETLFRSLSHREIQHDGKTTGLYLTSHPSRSDKMWSLYESASMAWATALPAAFASKFDVPKSLAGNDRYQKRVAEVAKLVKRALRLQGIPPEIAEATEVLVTASPIVPKTHRAEHYDAEGKTYRSHLRLLFPCEVKGPIIIGDGRYSGFGLCFPL